MITREEVRRLLDTRKTNEILTALENYIDKEIKRKLARGEKTIYISCGRPDNSLGRAVETPFYPLWCNKEITVEQMRFIRSETIKKYTNLFNVEERAFDEGWCTTFDGLVLVLKKNWEQEDDLIKNQPSERELKTTEE